mmetsp:Transcript_23603/g.45844  ORF Transcript_23603/g.45844 Transcript_23603/m.45844 type:complete len:256 (+) Transcript_23603:207-974(+)
MMCKHTDGSSSPAHPAGESPSTPLLDDVDPQLPTATTPFDGTTAQPSSSSGDPELETPVVASAVVDEEEEPPISDRAIVYGATTSGGLVGCVVGGPVLGLVGAGGAYYAVTRPAGSKVGEAAKRVGKTSVQCFRSAKKFCAKNEVVPKLKRAGSRAVEGAKGINDQYKVTERTQALAVGAYHTAKNVNEQYDVTGKVSRGFVAGLNKLSGDKENHPPQQQQQQQQQQQDQPPARLPPSTPTPAPTVPAPAHPTPV